MAAETIGVTHQIANNVRFGINQSQNQPNIFRQSK